MPNLEQEAKKHIEALCASKVTHRADSRRALRLRELCDAAKAINWVYLAVLLEKADPFEDSADIFAGKIHGAFELLQFTDYESLGMALRKTCREQVAFRDACRAFRAIA